MIFSAQLFQSCNRLADRLLHFRLDARDEVFFGHADPQSFNASSSGAGLTRERARRMVVASRWSSSGHQAEKSLHILGAARQSSRPNPAKNHRRSARSAKRARKWA